MPCARSRSSWIVSCTALGQPVDRRLGLLGIAVHQRSGELELHGERHQVLLGAVVQVAFDRATGLVAGGHDAASRTLQLVGLTPHLVERGLERGVEPDVVHRDTELPRELDHRALILRRERFRTHGAFHQQESEQLTGMRHRGGADEGVLTTGEQARQPHLHPAVADQSRLHHRGGFEAAHRDGRALDRRIADPRAELVAGRDP